MPKPLNVDWPAVQVLAVAVGVREAARQMGISQDAVRQRSKREGWMASPKAVAQRALAQSGPVHFRFAICDLSVPLSNRLSDSVAAHSSQFSELKINKRDRTGGGK
jgi:hypothetical protein